MALFNHATKEVTAKLVYYGPGLCGKTTNLQWIHENLNFRSKGKLVSLATQTDRTLFFDFLPVELGTIRGMRTRMQIYTVPGQVFYEATRRMVLKGCDAVVFVADSQAAMLDANFESLQSLRRNLLANEIDPAVPMVIQYNKRDLPTALPISVLNARLNPRNLPFFESVAFQGTGVEETLKGITKLLFKSLSDFYGDREAEAAASEVPSARTAAPAPQAPAAIKVRLPEPEAARRSGAPGAPAPSPPTATPRQKPAPSTVSKRTAPTPPAAAPAVTESPVQVRSTPPRPPAETARPPAPATASAKPAAIPAPPPVSPPTAAASVPKPAPARAPVSPQVGPSETTARPQAAPSREATPQALTPVPSPPREEAPVPAPPPAPAATPSPPEPPAATVSTAPVVPEAEEEEIDVELEPEPEEPPATILIRPAQAAPARPSAPPPAPPASEAPAVSAPAPPPDAPVTPPAATRDTARVSAAPAPASTPAPAPRPARQATPAAPPTPAQARAPEPAVFRESAPATPVEPAPRGEGLRSDQWLYLLEGAQRGPIDIEDLVDLVLTSIPENTKVWHPGLEGWVRANQVREISEEIPPPLPVPGAARGAFLDEDMPDFNTVPPQFRTALIADEDEAFRKYLAMPLAAQGFTIHEAADGSAAWLQAVQTRPWLILADVSMPEVDGFEFCRRVRSHPLLSHTPLLFISGSDKYKERYRALQIGADDFLSKQMPIRELLMRIQLLLTKYSDLGDQKAAGVADSAGAFQGRIEVFGAPALLQMCAQGSLNGILTALAEDEANTAAVMGFRGGDIISAAVGTVSGPEAVYAYLAWERGSFKFTPGDPGAGEPLAQSVEHLLLEGCRLLDESQRGGEAMDAPV